VPKTKIQKLYESEAAGLTDESLLEDVGISLCLRCGSILTVGHSKTKEVRSTRKNR
jgi:hypothetical protein